MSKKYVVKKDGKYWPNATMKKQAWMSDSKIYSKAAKNPVKFWEGLGREGIDWNKPWDKTYEEKIPYFKWFAGGKLNVSYNCLDRHIENGKGNKTAMIWVPEDTKEKAVKWTFKELHEKVCRFANVLKKQGIKKGDVISIYLPLIPEAFVAMLACTRLGVIHSVVFSAFSADALKQRIVDGKAKILITCDGYYRRGKVVDLVSKGKEAAKGTTIKKIVVVPRLGKKVLGLKTLDYNKEMSKVDSNCEPVSVKSEDIMFLLYTSGTTGRPKGIIHDTGGYTVQSYWTAKWNFDLHDDDIMWCTADIGWITGHTYAVYGPLLNGATSLIYEGSPDYPNFERFWRIVEKYKVSIFYTAPTAIRMFMRAGDKYVDKFKMDSLRLLATVGEPIDVDAWTWYFKKIGKGRCPIIDTWWQTETGGTLVNTFPGIGPFVPTIAGRSFPGTRFMIVDDKGKEVKKGEAGYLVGASPFGPGLLHGVYKNHPKYVKTYWKEYKMKYYVSSDGANLTKDGLIRVTGRTDDVMKVAGHRLATAEVENALNESKYVNESAVVPIPDKLRGQVPVAFVILGKGKPSEDLKKVLVKQVDKSIGPTARPAKIYFVSDLPKTRSGKIMRRILKNLLANEEPKGLMTLVNPNCVDDIKGIVSSGE